MTAEPPVYLNDPGLIAEDLASLAESAPWIVYIAAEPEEDAPGPFQPCENCGIIICAVSMRPVAHQERAGQFTRTWWEPGLGRLHSDRRCAVIRSLAGRDPVGIPGAIVHYGTCRHCGSWRWKKFAAGAWTIFCPGCSRTETALSGACAITRPSPMQ